MGGGGSRVTVVIDVGCATYGGDSSIPYLIEEFRPALLIGFDPNADVALEDMDWPATVRVVRAAAWTHAGEVTFEGEGLRGHVTGIGTAHARTVRCVDLHEEVYELATAPGADRERADVVLKMDAEGSEYVLLPNMIERGSDVLLRLAWIEWHCPFCGTGWFGNELPDTCGRCGHVEPGKRTELEQALRCEVAQWNR